jgi:NTP pyrophosphatase (non-canonical NTP hydrolase)
MNLMDEANIQAGLNAYQREATKVVFPHVRDNLMYFALELAEEAGEAAGKIKKMIRDDGGVMTKERKHSLQLEMGDVLWPLSQMARILDTNFGTIALMNLDKLADREKRGVLQGSGDYR